MVDPALDKKIDELFNYRLFPELYAVIGHDKHPSVKLFNDHLKALQAAIYYLDEYLESTWLLNKDVLYQKWEEIYVALIPFGIPKAKYDDYCKQIYRYERHETALRQNKLPSSYEMEYYYFFKSCDVKLMRKLIFESYPVLKQLFNLSDWRLFDLVTEINDDVQDIFEDLDTINGNRFLISAAVKGKGQVGKEFHTFLNQIEVRNQKINSNSKIWSNKIREITFANISQTKQLIDVHLDQINENQLTNVCLLNHLREKK
jgi:predicted AlkP superfamily pyrophosphatase or phosphodiesterase